MANQPRIPRVSIIVPFQRDADSFEETLVSVLEHQPAGSEVIVAHNGAYTDPFGLEGELKFVIARSSNLVDLVRDGFSATTAQFVHVVGTGLAVRPEWISRGLECFEHGHVAAVAPAIRLGSDAHALVETGWIDTPGVLCETNRVEGQSTADGCHLHACFFRRKILGALLQAVAPALVDPVAVSYAFGCLLRRAGWTTSIAADSVLERTSRFIDTDQSTSERGKMLASIRETVCPGAPPLRVSAMFREAIVGNGSLAEFFGMLRCHSNCPAMARMIDADCVPTYDVQSSILRMPAGTSTTQRVAA